MKRQVFVLILTLALFSGKAAAQCVSVGPAMAAICQGGTTAALGGSILDGTTSAVWSSGGAGGTFSNNSGSTPGTATWTPPAAYSGTATLTLTATGCSASPNFGSKTVTVTANLAVSVSIAASANPVCAGTNVTFTATPVNGGTPTYQWYKNTLPVGTNSPTYAYAPLSGDQIYVQMTSSLTCVTGNPNVSNTVSMTVNPNLPVSVTIAASANPVCAGTTVTFTATPVNGGTPTYQWYKNTLPVGTNSPTYAYIPVTGDQIYVQMTSSLTCVTGNPDISNTVAMIVNPNVPVSVTIAASANSVCAGATVTFIATPVNGGTPVYQWYKNTLPVGTNSPTYAYAPLSGDQIYVQMTSSLTCVTGNPDVSNTVSMTVNPNLPVSVTIAASANPVCAGATITFTATPVNGGTPVYQWFKNTLPVGTNSPTYAYIPVNGDQIYVQMTSSLTCVTGNPDISNAVAVIVNTNLPVSVTIAASANPVCTGTTVTFTATPVNGGTPVYQWYKNTLPVGTNSPTYAYIPVNGDQIYVRMTSSLTCVTGNPGVSNTVSMNVNTSLPVSVSIAASANPVCAGATVTFTATPVNGGTPVYQWYKNTLPVGTNSPTYAYIPVTGDQIYVQMTSSLTCVTGNPDNSNAVAMIVNPNLPVSLTIAASANPVCAGTSVTFTATPTNGGTTPVYQWKLNGVNVGTNSNTYSNAALVTGNLVTCVLTSNATCATGSPATSNTITMTVSPNLPVDVTIAASANPVCAGTSVIFTATPVNGGTPIYQWYKNGIAVGTNSPTYTYIPLQLDQVHVEMTSSLTCVTGNPSVSNTVIMTVNPILPVSVSIATTTNPVCVTIPVTLTATPTNGGATPSYQWKVNGINVGLNSPTYIYTPVNNDAISCVLTSNASCISGNPATSNTIILNVTPIVGVPAIPTPSASTICQGSANTSYTTSATNVTTYNWTVSGTGNSITTGSQTGTVTWAPGFSGIATVSVTANGCSGPSAVASTTVAVRPSPVATINGSATVCQNATAPNVTFANPQDQAIVVTYNINGINPTQITVGANSSASVIASTSTTGTFVYNLVSADYQTAPTCTNVISGNATIRVNASPTPTLTRTDPDSFICQGTSVTFTAGGGTNYNFRLQGTTVQNGTSNTYTTSSLANGQVISVIVTNANGCVAAPIGITNFVNPPPFIFVTTPATCSPDLTTYSLSVAVSTGTVTSSSGTVTSIGGNVWTISGVHSGTNVTIRVTDANSCENTLAVTAPNCSCPVISAPVSGGDKSYCASEIIPFINVTVSAGETADWYSASSGGSPLISGSLTYTPSAAGTYYAIARNITTGCVSSTRTAVTVVMNALPIPTLTSSDPDNSFCAGTSVTFTAGGGTTYNFRVGGIIRQSGLSPTYTTSTLTNGQIVEVVVINTNGCSAISSGITNTVNTIPAPNAGTGGSECDLNFNFHAVPGIGTGTWTRATGPGTVTFSPNANSATATVTVSQYGTYTFTWTEINAGCSSGATITVIFNQQPVANPGTGGNSCGKETLLNAITSVGAGTWTKTAGSGTAIFTPNANTPNASVTVSTFEAYTFTWTEVNGTCSNSASVSVNFLQVPAANAGVGGSECDLDFILKAVQGSATGTWTKFSGPGDAIFSPDANKAGATVTVSQFGTYDFAWTERSSVCQSSDLVRVVFNALPAVSAGTDTTICLGGSAQLGAQGVGTFHWEPDSLANSPVIGNPIVTPLKSTLFKVTLTDLYGCMNFDEVLVGVVEKPIADAGIDQTLDYVLETTMDAVLTNVYETGTWAIISGTGAISDTEDAKTAVTGLSLDVNSFLWTVTNHVCPVSSDTVTITVRDFIIPTLITPNLDGNNDYFVLRGLSTLGKTELVIFDRRGVKVYQNSDYDNSWDGVDYNKNALPDDTYFYVLKTKNGKSLSGYIVIRR